MSRIFKRDGDPNWWLDYTDSRGQRHRVKTDTTSSRKAEDLLAEVRASRKRIALGLEVAPSSRVGTLGDAWWLWLTEWCPAGSKVRELRRYNANVKSSWVAQTKMTDLSGETLEKWFTEKLKSQSPRTVNGHRRIIRCVVNVLIRKRMFRGVNPVKETVPFEEADYPHQILTEAEFFRILPHVAEGWRDLAVLAFSTGLRRGEIFALRKDLAVLDLDTATLMPRASNAREIPKGKRVRGIPLMPEAIEVLRRAWATAEWGHLLFPSPGTKNRLRSEHSKSAEVIRSAMISAGMVESWNHECRKPTCPGHLDGQPDEQQRQCPVCSWVMWPKPVVRHVRFHDLRHSCATFLLSRGVEMSIVQEVLRHSTIVITQKTYAHRTVEHVREALSRAGVGSAERELSVLAESQENPEAAEIIREAQEKLALIRHRTSNVVPLIPSKIRT